MEVHFYHQNDSGIKMDSDGENHSLIVRDSHKTVSTDHNS